MSITNRYNRTLLEEVISELKWTEDHFKMLYQVAKDKGVWNALKYDNAVTRVRRKLIRMEEESLEDRY